MAEKSKRETLGSLMKSSEESESSVAARVYANSTSLNSPEDLKPEHISKLREYTEGHTEGNKYRPSTNEKESPSLDSGELSQDQGFLNDVPSAAKTHYETSNSGLFTSADSIIDLGGKKFTKNSLGSVGSDVLTGHTLLSSEAPSKHVSPRPGNGVADLTRVDPRTERDRPIAAAVYESLISKNVYHPSSESPFLNYTERGEGAFSNGIFSFQRELGVFDKNADRISIKELRKVAGDLLLKAQSISEGDVKTVIDSFSDNGYYGGTLDKLVLIPHMTQIGGGQIDTKLLRARVRKAEEMSASFEEDRTYTGQDDLLIVQGFQTIMGGGAQDPFISSLSTSRNANSYGTMTSPAEPFDGPFPAGMALPVIFSMLIIGVVGNFVIPMAVDQLKDSGNVSVRDPESPQTLVMGRNYATSHSVLNRTLELFGFPRSEGAGFWGTLMAGLMTFYGLQAPITPFSAFGPDFLNSCINILFAPGYYLVITKGILRDIEKITSAFSNINASSGVFGAITSFFVAIESVFSSFTLKFLITMVKTGQQIMKGLMQPGRDGHGGLVPTYNDQKRTTAETLTGKNRLSYSRIHSDAGEDAASPLSLRKHMAAWLSNEIHASLSTQVLPAKGNGEGEPVKILESHVAADAVVRLTPEQVEYVENIIDAEYVPFSIQDLRTNEIFSLPAFIVSLSDDFSVQHGTSHGYGRTDPVYSYAKTTRSINLVFNMIAMNEKDHNYLYILLNKIVAMCYPQRDRGLIRSKGEQFFAQPFSQTPTASPVVRIRLGDLISSNKSTLAMQNIFGGRDTLGLKAKKTDNLSEKSQENTANRREKLLTTGVKKRDLLKTFAAGGGSEISFVIPAGSTIAAESEEGKFTTFRSLLPLYTKIKGTRDFEGSPSEVTLGKTSEDAAKNETLYEIDITEPVGDQSSAYNFGGKTLAAFVPSDSGLTLPSMSLSSLTGGGAKFPKAYIKKSTKIDYFDEDVLELELGGDETKKQIESFLDPATNPVVRSINLSSPGRGLAGVITQLSLSYEGALWGTGEESRLQGLKAPQRIQVTLNFAPIHDMPLGLDANGDVFAPSHPVGSYSKKSLDGKKASHQALFTEELKKANNLDKQTLTDPTKPSLPF